VNQQINKQIDLAQYHCWETEDDLVPNLFQNFDIVIFVVLNYPCEIAAIEPLLQQ